VSDPQETTPDGPGLNGPDLWLSHFPWPTPDTHKHVRGRLSVVGGGPWSTGAARLAARGALRIGAGFVTLLSPRDAAAVYAAHLEAVVLRVVDEPDHLAQLVGDQDAVVIGPGAGVEEGTSAKVLAAARTGAALVLDADALTVFRHDPDALFATLDRDDLLTPHEGEFERLFPGLLGTRGRAGAAQEAALRAGAVVLLKGSRTLVAAPDGRLAENAPASPWLATAGSGDVLAGFAGGLMAQGMDSWEAACAAAWIHAACAEAFGPGLIAEDLPDLAPAVLRRLQASGRGVAPAT
jgi:hydroxyethylthiazole kinase-like uncharacterized protein yjeF